MDYASSVSGVMLRITKLNSDGTPMCQIGGNAATKSVYIMKAFMSLSFNLEYEEGEEITEKNAAGEICITYKSPDSLKRLNMELAVCDPDPELMHLLSGGRRLSAAAAPGDMEIVGYAAPQIGPEQSNYVGLEVWSNAVYDGGLSTDGNYWHWVIPRVKLRPSGDRVIENGVLANTFSGEGVGNARFGNGPDTLGDALPRAPWDWASVTDSPYAYARTNKIPSRVVGDTWEGNDGDAHRGWYVPHCVALQPGGDIVDPIGVDDKYAKPDPLDKTKYLGQSFSDLTALQGDPTVGDGHGPKDPTSGLPYTMVKGEYVNLADGSTAHYDSATGAWVAGAKP